MAGDVAGTISRIKVENFMCHSNLTIDLIDNVNFITGQNGSGKSAILTALCVAFGCKARGTQRASSLKDFIKTGCSYALVSVELKNGGPEAFKPEIYGDLIFVERRITATSTTITMKDYQGRKVGSKKEGLHDLIDHFNIDVENPCVIMSQDKSREFLHSGNDKEKFKFFYKATLLQQVSDLLDANQRNIEECERLLDENAETFRPYEESLAELDRKIERAQQVDVMAADLVNLKKRLAWAHVGEVDGTIADSRANLQKYMDRMPQIKEKIAEAEAKRDAKMEALSKAKEDAKALMERCDEINSKNESLREEASQISREKARLEEQLDSKLREMNRAVRQKRTLEESARTMREKYEQNTQEEAHRRSSCIEALEREISTLKGEIESLEEAIKGKHSEMQALKAESERISAEIRERQRRIQDANEHIRRLVSQQRNKVTAFGGDKVLHLLRSIESSRRDFHKPPIGPIGSHLTLEQAQWAIAVDVAVGGMFNNFVVTDHHDMLRLRELAKRCGYEVPIIIYNFDHPALNVPHNILDPNLITVLSVLQIDRVTIKNVLIDQANLERAVLVKDYDEGKRIAYDKRAHPRVREAYLMDGTKMFKRAGAETSLPRDSRREPRLESATDERISAREHEKAELEQSLGSLGDRKRRADDSLSALAVDADRLKRRRFQLEQNVNSKERNLREVKRQAEEASLDGMPAMDEVEKDIKDSEEEVRNYENEVNAMRSRIDEVKGRLADARRRHDELQEASNEDLEALSRAQREIEELEQECNAAVTDYDHYVKMMENRVLKEIKAEEEHIQQLERRRQESVGKASQICSEEEIEALGGANATVVQLSKEVISLQKRIDEENRVMTPAAELRDHRLRLERKISKRKQVHTQLKEKVELIAKIYEKRRAKFHRNSCYMRKQIKWQFNEHLKKKAFSGTVKIDYEEKTLKLEVMMPQDNSNSAVQDTRALSGGERSFSTLCFALALHEMTEAPFRAMDEFDVFMDQISRKLSLDKVVEFAINQGSQWIFITPHDISTVKDHPKLKKQQMSAPRS